VIGETMIPMRAVTLLLKITFFRKNNGANESQNSPLENYKVIFRRSTPKGRGGLNLIIAECR